MCSMFLNNNQPSNKSTEDVFEVNETKEDTNIDLQTAQGNVEYIKYTAANRYRSNDKDKDMQAVFCVDPDTGSVYFINLDKDRFIYRLSGKTAELVLAVPAKQLNILNGTLYFVVDGEGLHPMDGVKQGDVYAYTLKDKTGRMIFSTGDFEGELYYMTVLEEGIALEYRQVKEVLENGARKMQVYWKFYSFEKKAMEEDLHKLVYPGWGNYYLQPTETNGIGKTVLRSRTGDKSDSIDWNVYATNSFIIDNIMYAYSGEKIYITDMLTGEQTIYDSFEIFKNLAPLHASHIEEKGQMICALTVTGESVWAILMNQYLLRIDHTTKEMGCYLFSMDENAINRLNIEDRMCELYTDGTNIYGVYTYGETTWNDGVLVRINTEEPMGQQKYQKVPVLKVDYVTE